MSVYTRPEAGRKIYWYRFMHNGVLIRRSTKQSNYKIAVAQEATHKATLSNGDIGILERPIVPTLAEFAKEFLRWAAAEFQAKPKTLAYYQNSVARLSEYAPLMSLPMDDKRIPERLVGYKTKRQADGLQVSSINHELRCVRRLLRLAQEWGRIEVAPKIKLLSGEAHRERVVTPKEEAKYLAAAPPLLASCTTILIDSGLRPEELFRLDWSSITWTNGRHGTLMVTHGKTTAARRVVPLTARVRAVLERHWQAANQPADGWVFPAPTKSGHMEPSTVKKQHRRALRDSKVKAFVLYSLRHTFLTRLGESGCDVWTLARIAGHSTVAMSMRYVHPGSEKVLAAMGGHVFGHTPETEEDAKELTA